MVAVVCDSHYLWVSMAGKVARRCERCPRIGRDPKAKSRFRGLWGLYLCPECDNDLQTELAAWDYDRAAVAEAERLRDAIWKAEQQVTA